MLLIKRSANRRIFPGRYNGVGGHMERGEDPFTCAVREIKEETGLTVQPGDVRLRGVSHIDAGGTSGIVLFIFTIAVKSQAGTLDECHEGTLHWIPIDRALDLPLVEDLPILWPRLFGPNPDDKPFFAHVSYNSADQIQMRFTGD